MDCRTTVHPFNTFDPYMHVKDDRVVFNFILQALKGRSSIFM